MKWQPVDYGPIAETPGTGLSQEQFQRFVHRYAFGAKLAQARRVLEVACGAGTGAGYLQRAAKQLVGFDYTESLLRQFKSHYGASVPLACGDAQRLPFDAATFDLVLCFEAIYYLDDYRAFLADSHRILAPNGRLLITLSNPDWPNFVPGSLSTYYPPAPELARSLAETGFRSVQIFGLLPTSRQTSRQSLVHSLRRVFLHTNVLPLTGFDAYFSSSFPDIAVEKLASKIVMGTLKRVAYGRLQSLPAELDGEEIRRVVAELPLATLSTQQRDRVHRVLYLQAEV